LIEPEKEGRPLPEFPSWYFQKKKNVSDLISLSFAELEKTHRRGDDRSSADSLERTQHIQRDVVCDVTVGSKKGSVGFREKNVN